MRRLRPILPTESLGADTRHCWWEDPDGQIVIQHLWGQIVNVPDSTNGEVWTFRKCVICGDPDVEMLADRYHEREAADEAKAEAPAAPDAEPAS